MVSFFNMENAYRRKKAPETVRRALLDSAARIAVERGLGAVTVQAVATAAGVTKGGLFHHFTSKEQLVFAMFDEQMEALDEHINAYLAEHGGSYGCFTRAYIEATLNSDIGRHHLYWEPLVFHMMADDSLQIRWADWLAARLEQHQATDSDPMLKIVRLAADGAWLAYLTKADETCKISLPDVRKRLMKMTLKK